MGQSRDACRLRGLASRRIRYLRAPAVGEATARWRTFCEMKDKVVLVTGGSSGIGRAAKLAFARKGAKVLIAARGAECGHGVAREIEAAGGRALFVRADVSQAADVHGLAPVERDSFSISV